MVRLRNGEWAMPTHWDKLNALVDQWVLESWEELERDRERKRRESGVPMKDSTEQDADGQPDRNG